ncbi:PepSY-associated TM helix domain-containing protein [Gracilibacillus xinjiangensis]|uniref:PepSY-associated TM helix domain-containing protein n=1 Tax=Gracilibacillus xinjiangensis TaxID=1193282 RepID=A0ABV8WRZ6_9BACI
MLTRENRNHHANIYQIVWRWHFYAGVIIAPILLILAVTGSIYLFKPQIEAFIYADYYQVQEQGEKLAPSAHTETVLAEYPDAKITKYRPGEDSTRSAEVRALINGESFTFFIDPYTSGIIGKLNDQHRFIDRVEEFHGELMLGTFGDRMVELAACWTLILITTGLYIWFPRKRQKIFGVLIPRFNRNRRILFRDLHAVTGFWLSIAIIFLVLSGLIWSGFWGTKVQTLLTNAGVGYPPSIWVGSAPESGIQTKDIADVPWSAQTMPVPSSNQHSGFIPLSIDDVVHITDKEKIYPTYEVIYPSSAKGVYTVSVFPPQAKDEATMHIDQYSGAILADYRYDNYQPLGKLLAWGITVHKGLEYGVINQIGGFIVCLGIISLVISGWIMWWRRKPRGRLGSPNSPSILTKKRLTILLLIFSIIFPLVGLSVIIIFLLDWTVLRRIPRLKKFLT